MTTYQDRRHGRLRGRPVLLDRANTRDVRLGEALIGGRWPEADAQRLDDAVASTMRS